jgi:SacI restriction endonuclease
MKLNKKRAEEILREEIALAATGQVDAAWVAKVEKVSKFCEGGAPETHVAFLGTLRCARATEARADLFHIKPTLSKGNPNAYSARTLSEDVLVPLSAEFGFSIGVSGRQPLNNQPYFRMTYLGDNTPISSGGRAVFDYMIELIRELSAMSPAAARQALRAFVAVRKNYQRRYDDAGEAVLITPAALLAAISRLVAADSEGGRRAQAVVAGLLDVVAGEDRVESGRINDPSRHYPGDVAVLAPGETEAWEKSFEVRDKLVPFSDIAIFGRTCVDRGVREAAVVMVASGQAFMDADKVREWAERYGLSITLYHGWESFVDQCLFWAAPAKPEAAGTAVETIRERLIGVEASPEAVTMWEQLTRGTHLEKR